MTDTLLTLVGAYGRDQKNKKDIISDIKANKDFQIMPTAKYINLQDMRTHNITSFNVRYKRLMNLAHINIAKDIK